MQESPKTQLAALNDAANAPAWLAKDARVVVLTISDRCSQGVQVDRSGPAVVELLESAGADAVVTETLPDELEQIAAALRRHAVEGGKTYSCNSDRDCLAFATSLGLRVVFAVRGGERSESKS